MKQLTIKLAKSPLTYVIGWFILIFALATMFSSCATGYVGCDAYGQQSIENIDSLDIENLAAIYAEDISQIEELIRVSE